MNAVIHLPTTGFGTSGGELALSALFALAFAVFGYRISVRFRSVRGVTPWRLPSLVWAIICLVLQPFGIIVELFAQFTTGPSPDLATPEVAPTRALPEVPYAVAPRLPELDLTGPPAPRDPAGRIALFGWYPDPAGRHELRYFDGRRWSDGVRDAGVDGTEPL